MRKVILLAAVVFLFQSTSFAQQSSAPLSMTSGFFGWQFRQGDEKVSMSKVADLMSSNEQAAASFRSARSNNTLASIIGGIGGFLVGYQLGTSAGGGEANWTVAAVGGGLIVGSIPLSASAVKKARNAVELYNQGLQSTSYRKPQLFLGATPNGMGLSLHF